MFFPLPHIKKVITSTLFPPAKSWIARLIFSDRAFTVKRSSNKKTANPLRSAVFCLQNGLRYATQNKILPPEKSRLA